MPPAVTRRYRLLLIEDDEADTVLVERALENFPGFELRAVDRLQAAVDALASERFDAALLDLSLPDSFGLEGVETLHARVSDLPVVVLTGLSDNDLAMEALDRGAQDYLAKGQFAPEVLVRTVRYAIQRQQIQGENRRLLAELGRQARHDSLTGIINRRSLVAELEREWHLATRSRLALSCVMIDLDFFKRINDRYGHAVGDTVLEAVAALLCETCRAGDLPGRYGGEEFLVILPQTTEEGAVVWADRLRRSIAGLPIAAGGDTLYVTASFGVAQRTADLANCEQLVDRADQALRLAKQIGRDQVVSFDEASAIGSATRRGDAFARLAAEDIMTPLVATLESQTTLREATNFLLKLRLDSAPIVDRQGNLVGIVGEEDLAQALAGPAAWERPVAEIMRKGNACFPARTSAAAVHDFLARVAARRVIILDDQRPVGIVSWASILRWHEYHGQTGPAPANLTPATSTPPAEWQRLAQFVQEIEHQATGLRSGLLAGDTPPAELAVAAATRIESLLEDAVAHAQRLGPTGQATIGSMLG
jgi:diguanylate cyclase (GGDEF)-like protein